MPREVRQVTDLLERRWLLSILWASAEGGAVRFNEFRQVLGPVPPRTLALRLVELEEAGVLARVVVDARPPRVEYRLTDAGRRLTAVVDALRRVAEPIELRSQHGLVTPSEVLSRGGEARCRPVRGEC
jgi:DNA-binding HxlR family transcriptional regulator